MFFCDELTIIRKWRSLLAHLVLFLLGLAERDMLLRRCLVEASSAKLALREIAVSGIIQDLLLLFCGHVVLVPGLLYTRTQLEGLRLPLRYFFLGLLLFDLLLDDLALLHQFLLLISDDALILGIEFLSLLLEDLSADVLMLGNAIGIELPTAALTALHQFRRIVFPDLHSILTVDFLDALLLESAAGVTRLLPVLLLWGLL